MSRDNVNTFLKLLNLYFFRLCREVNREPYKILSDTSQTKKIEQGSKCKIFPPNKIATDNTSSEKSYPIVGLKNIRLAQTQTD